MRDRRQRRGLVDLRGSVFIGEHLLAYGALPVRRRAFPIAGRRHRLAGDQRVRGLRQHRGRSDFRGCVFIGEELSAFGALPVGRRAFLLAVRRHRRVGGQGMHLKIQPVGIGMPHAVRHRRHPQPVFARIVQHATERQRGIGRIGGLGRAKLSEPGRAVLDPDFLRRGIHQNRYGAAAGGEAVPLQGGPGLLRGAGHRDGFLKYDFTFLILSVLVRVERDREGVALGVQHLLREPDGILAARRLNGIPVRHDAVPVAHQDIFHISVPLGDVADVEGQAFSQRHGFRNVHGGLRGFHDIQVPEIDFGGLISVRGGVDGHPVGSRRRRLAPVGKVQGDDIPGFVGHLIFSFGNSIAYVGSVLRFLRFEHQARPVPGRMLHRVDLHGERGFEFDIPDGFRQGHIPQLRRRIHFKEEVGGFGPEAVLPNGDPGLPRPRIQVAGAAQGADRIMRSGIAVLGFRIHNLALVPRAGFAPPSGVIPEPDRSLDHIIGLGGDEPEGLRSFRLLRIHGDRRRRRPGRICHKVEVHGPDVILVGIAPGGNIHPVMSAVGEQISLNDEGSRALKRCFEEDRVVLFLVQVLDLQRDMLVLHPLQGRPRKGIGLPRRPGIRDLQADRIDPVFSLDPDILQGDRRGPDAVEPAPDLPAQDAGVRRGQRVRVALGAVGPGGIRAPQLLARACRHPQMIRHRVRAGDRIGQVLPDHDLAAGDRHRGGGQVPALQGEGSRGHHRVRIGVGILALHLVEPDFIIPRLQECESQVGLGVVHIGIPGAHFRPVRPVKPPEFHIAPGRLHAGDGHRHIPADVAVGGDRNGGFPRIRGHRQPAGLAQEVDDLRVIGIGNVSAGGRVDILLVGDLLRISVQEQAAGGSHGAGVAVGDVSHVVPAAHGHDVPHVRAFAGAAGHHAGDADHGGAAEAALVAQELEGLGVALADHLGGIVPVKDVDQLPGVAVGRAIVHCVMVVIHMIADILLVGLQLVQVGFVLVAVHHAAGIFRGRDGPGAVGGVQGVSAGGVIYGIVGGNLVGEGQHPVLII